MTKIYPTVNEIINCLRQLPMFIIFPILLIFNFIKAGIEKTRYIFPLLSLFFYFSFQLPGLILTDNSLFNIGYIISALNILLILNLSYQLLNEKSFKIFFFVTLFFLLLINLVNIEVYLHFLKLKSNTLYTYFDLSSDVFFGKSSPRSTGTARSLLLIYLISILIFKDFFNNFKKLNYFFYVGIAALILLFQSRTVIVLLLVFILFNFFYLKKKNIFKYIIYYIIVPFISLYSFVIFQDQINKNIIKKNISIINKDIKDTSFLEDLEESGKKFKRPIDPYTYSSGRYDDWKNLISKTNKSFYFGFGSQADRFLINQTASNGLIYAYSSSGIIGLLFYCIFILSCLFKIFENLILRFRQSADEKKMISIIILILILRSILESSFAVFSIDLIILITLYINLMKKDKLVKYGI